jgi:hypothetical protein
VKKITSNPAEIRESPSTYAERLEFVIWYAMYTRGLDGANKLAEAIGKGKNTLSKWSKKQPSFELSKMAADAVGVSPSWLHDPRSSDAVEPEWFANWLRSQRLAAHTAARQVPAPRRKRGA